MDWVFPPLLQRYELPDEAVNMMESPLQIAELEEGVMLATGNALTFIFKELLIALHPEAFVTVTEYGVESFT